MKGAVKVVGPAYHTPKGVACFDGLPDGSGSDDSISGPVGGASFWVAVPAVRTLRRVADLTGEPVAHLLSEFGDRVVTILCDPDVLAIEQH